MSQDLTTLDPIIIGDGSTFISMRSFLGRFEHPLLTHNYFQNEEVCPFTTWNLEKLISYNENEQYDLFFTPNGQLWRWQEIVKNDANSIKYDYLVMDTDDDDDWKIMSWIIECINFYWWPEMPTMIVKTGRGYHTYYKLLSSLKSDTEKQMYCDLFTLLKEDFKLDTKVQNISRWFRMPFSKYWKRKKDNKPASDWQFVTKLIWSKKENILDFHSFFSAFSQTKDYKTKDEKSERKLISYAASKWASNEMAEILNRANSIQFQEIFDALWIQYKWAFLYEWWRVTDWWRLNKAKNYVNNFSNWKESRPQWEPYWFVYKHYNNSFFETRNFFQNNFWIQYNKCSSIWDIKFGEEESSPELEKKVYVIKEERIWELIIDTENKQMFFSAGTAADPVPTKISDFIIKPLWIVQTNIKQNILVQLVSPVQESHSFFLPIESAMSWFNKEILAFWQFKFYRWGSSVLSLISIWIQSLIPNLPKISMKTAIWFCEEGFILNESQILWHDWEICAFDPKKNMYEKTLLFLMSKEPEGNAWLWKKATSKIVWFDINAENEDYSSKDFKKLILQDLPSIYNSAKIVTLLLWILWIIAWPTFKMHWRKWPHLMVWWETQAWKTSNMNMVKDILWFKPSSAYNASVTPFPLLMATTTGSPVHITEYREDVNAMLTIKQIMRDAFDGRDFMRWTAWLDVKSYPMVSSLIVEWNHAVHDSACQTRSFVIHMTRKDIVRMSESEYQLKLRGIIKDNWGLLKWFISNHLSWINNNFRKFDDLIVHHKTKILKDLTSQFVWMIEDTERTCEIYSYILALYDRMSGWEGIDTVRKMMIDNIIYFFKSYKLIDDISWFINCLFKLILNMITSWSQDVIEYMSYQPATWEIHLMKICFDKFIRNSSEKEEFENALANLTQMWVIDTDWFSIVVKTFHERLSKSHIVIKTIVESIKKRKGTSTSSVTFNPAPYDFN